jgi:hypothetical protein
MQSADKNVVVWKLAPSFQAAMTVWDDAAESCHGNDGAECGGIGSGGSGSFSGTRPNEKFTVTQSYTDAGGSCSVSNTVRWESGGVTGEATGTYQCSGATALGWPLLGVAFAAATGVAYWVRRKAQR